MAEQQQHTEGQAEEDEAQEMVDLSTCAWSQQWWSAVFGSRYGPMAEKHSVATQIGMGGLAGWCVAQASEFVKKNVVASSGFVGGFLLGLAS